MRSKSFTDQYIYVSKCTTWRYLFSYDTVYEIIIKSDPNKSKPVQQTNGSVTYKCSKLIQIFLSKIPKLTLHHEVIVLWQAEDTGL